MSNQNFSIDDALVRQLAGLLDETRLTEIEYAWGEHRIRVTRQPAAIQATAPTGVAVAALSPAAAPVSDDPSKHPGAVNSPMVGTAYLAAQPGAAPFIRVGDTVAAGQTLLIIEAMKVMNQIHAPKPGRVVRILADDGMPVEFGQALVILE